MTSFQNGQAPWQTSSPSSFVAGSAPWEKDPTSAAVSQVQKQLNPDPQTAHPLDSLLSSQGQTNAQAAGTTLKNIPGSALNFVKNLTVGMGKQAIDMFKDIPKNVSELPGQLKEVVSHPIKAAEAIPSVIQAEEAGTRKVLTPMFIQHLVKGDLTSAQAAIESDPVGQIAPLVLAGRELAEGMGKGQEFDSAVSKVAKPVQDVASKVGEGAKNAASETLGVTTGSGGEAIRQAAAAGAEVAKTPSGGAAFTDAMRGKSSPSEIVNNAQDALQTIKEKQGADYRAKLQGIKDTKGSLDISPLKTELDKQMGNFGIKVSEDGTLDFTRSTIGNDDAAMSAVKKAYEDVNGWGTKEGDRTAVGLDTLKRRLDDLYAPTKQSRAFTQALKSSVRKTLSSVPGYDEMTKDYENTANVIDDIKSATSLGGKAGVDTVFKKLSSAMKQNQDLRLEMTKALEDTSGKGVLDQVAGQNLNSILPRGLIGKGADLLNIVKGLGGAIHPAALIEFALTSPRIVGEFVRGLGWSAEKISQVLGQVDQVRSLLAHPAIVSGALNPSSEKTPEKDTQETP